MALFWSGRTLFRHKRSLCWPERSPYCHENGPFRPTKALFLTTRARGRPCVDLAVICRSGRTVCWPERALFRQQRVLLLPKRSMCWLEMFLCWYEKCPPDRQSALSGWLRTFLSRKGHNFGLRGRLSACESLVLAREALCPPERTLCQPERNLFGPRVPFQHKMPYDDLKCS